VLGQIYERKKPVVKFIPPPKKKRQWNKKPRIGTGHEIANAWDFNRWVRSRQ
jgi:hypothetical protein